MNTKATVCENVILRCSFGTNKSELIITDCSRVRIQGKKICTIDDHISNVNIKSFGYCTIQNPPIKCTPITPTKWLNGSDEYKVKNVQTLLNTCITPCVKGGIISIDDNAGQKKGR